MQSRHPLCATHPGPYHLVAVHVPHGLTFEHAAGMFGLRYYRPDSPTAFREVYQTWVSDGEPALIEVVTDRAANAELHRRLDHEVVKAIDHDR